MLSVEGGEVSAPGGKRAEPPLGSRGRRPREVRSVCSPGLCAGSSALSGRRAGFRQGDSG